jgi:hypothetical protein
MADGMLRPFLDLFLEFILTLIDPGLIDPGMAEPKV